MSVISDTDVASVTVAVYAWRALQDVLTNLRMVRALLVTLEAACSIDRCRQAIAVVCWLAAVCRRCLACLNNAVALHREGLRLYTIGDGPAPSRCDPAAPRVAQFTL